MRRSKSRENYRKKIARTKAKKIADDTLCRRHDFHHYSHCIGCPNKHYTISTLVQPQPFAPYHDRATELQTGHLCFFRPELHLLSAFWQVADPVQKALHLDIRWVPVAFLKANSMAKDAAILMAPNSAQAFEYNETHFHQSAEEGGIQGEATAPTGLIHAVLANNEMMETVLKNRGTPTIVYKIDGKIKVQRGLPSSQSAIYTILTGK
ncbi:hypothetical protein B1757_13610 [Acidithiobacillus marinus]|uniref:Thioredoxin-like fold domain-containing protein n=2 Tax=Acidithiobacillus marinus TaxID=187490 RepID=A0A2I1DID3_9PROT|nr:hypothetical protein B1757_13610 [Acidithiobacillus marinus]